MKTLVTKPKCYALLKEANIPRTLHISIVAIWHLGLLFKEKLALVLKVCYDTMIIGTI